MRIPDLLAIVRILPEKTPISELYERRQAIYQKRKPWYASQREHWTGWLGEYHGPGAYGRNPSTAHQAAHVWGRLQCLGMLIWLAEAAGIKRDTLRKAIEAATVSGLHHSKQCGQFRALVPWVAVESALTKKLAH